MSGPDQLSKAVAFTILSAMGTMAQGGIFDFGERPLGTEANRQAAEYIAGEAARMGYDVQRFAFKCIRWEKKESFAERGGVKVEVFASPFSPAFDQFCDVVGVETTGQLKRARCDGKILLMRGTIAKEPLMPRDYPFYFPDEHKEIYALLSERKPLAILAKTGPHPACGLDPAPLFDDANFRIPSAYFGAEPADTLFAAQGKIRLKIDSKTFPETGEQIVARKKATGVSQGKIAIFAHMDTAYGTPGALDNAAGVAVLLAAMEGLKNYSGPYDLEFIPFNGEDSPMVKGEMAYLENFGREMMDIRLGINIDAIGCKGSKTAVSDYNLADERQVWLDGEIAKHKQIERGPAWVESDHSIFVVRGVPCLALTSSNLRESVMSISHTPQDTKERVDRELLIEAADFVAELVKGF